MKKLVTILPFLDSQEVKELALQVVKGEVKGVKLVMLFPFLRNDDLDEIVEILIENKDRKALQHVLPFARRKTVDKIYQAVQNGEITGMKETSFYPFLGKEQLKSMFKDLLAKAQEEADDEDEHEVHVHINKDMDDEEFNFDIDLDIEDEVEEHIEDLKHEMKELKAKLKILQSKKQ